jgi:methylmalonyl-CoA mutase cobalamin-binding subunit
MVPAMDEVGKRFECEEYFVPELLLGARDEGLAGADPAAAGGAGRSRLGRVAIGTVKGDLHDIGKNLVASMLEGGGFEVMDLGADVAPEKFVEAVQERGANDRVPFGAADGDHAGDEDHHRRAQATAGVREKVKVLVGGAPVTAQYADRDRRGRLRRERRAWISGGTDIYGNAYSWVSYAATGHYQLSPPNVADSIILPNPNPPTATFYEYFTLTHNAIGGKVTFWADDTARIYLESKAGAILLREANPIQDSACAAGPIACEPLEGFEYVVGALAPGDYRFRIEAYQRGSGPFGVMYTGAIMTDAPEPGTIALFGAGLAVVAWGASRRRRKY